eukprot:IDg2980t1
MDEGDESGDSDSDFVMYSSCEDYEEERGAPAGGVQQRHPKRQTKKRRQRQELRSLNGHMRLAFSEGARDPGPNQFGAAYFIAGTLARFIESQSR